MRRLLLVLMVCGLVFLVISTTAVANPHARPFKGHAVGTIAFSPDPTLPPPSLWVTAEAVGNASHLGLTTLSGRHAAANAFGGEMMFTAANGDTITMSYVGSGAIPADIQIGDWYDTTSENTITGGTGRFAHATGKFDMTGRLQFLGLASPVWPAVWTWKGKIKY
ncbi:MAG: hypothetical protein ACM3MJ_00820 [Deltaproteobacteria bacterium]